MTTWQRIKDYLRTLWLQSGLVEELPDSRPFTGELRVRLWVLPQDATMSKQRWSYITARLSELVAVSTHSGYKQMALWRTGYEVIIGGDLRLDRMVWDLEPEDVVLVRLDGCLKNGWAVEVMEYFGPLREMDMMWRVMETPIEGRRNW